MQKFAECCEAVGATTKKLRKRALVAEHLRSRALDEAAVSAVFLSGRAFPVWEETTLGVGGTQLWRLVAEIAEKDEAALTAAYRRLGDLGAVAGEVLSERTGQGVGVLEVAGIFRRIAAARGPALKIGLVRDLLIQARPIEAKYIVKIMTGDLRIGLKESLVEDAVAAAFGATLAEVQRANMLLGDVGETLRLAVEGKLGEAKMRMFHPIGLMLASPVESAEEGLSYFAEAAVEDKYDGVRAQAHVAGDEVKFFSRTRDEITESFPELPSALAGLAQDAILDGEIVAWEYPAAVEPAAAVVDEEFSPEAESKAGQSGRARPFSALQQRLGRKKVSDAMLRDVPVAYFVFDVLYAGGELLIDRSLRERAARLDVLLAMPRETLKHPSASLRAGSGHGGSQGRPEQPQLGFDGDETSTPPKNVMRAPMFRAASAADLDDLFAAAQARGNEGLMIKDLSSSYLPGKRGKSWLKMKRELATLDVVVTAVEFGHGRRIGVLSDYTFAVWNGDKEKERLVNIGKAYSGLTDAEIAEMTKWFLEHTVEDHGFRRTVEPKIVLEVAFNNMMKSERHESGYALRFPRIVRLRPDKLAEDADRMERVREIFEKQSAPPSA